MILICLKVILLIKGRGSRDEIPLLFYSQVNKRLDKIIGARNASSSVSPFIPSGDVKLNPNSTELTTELSSRSTGESSDLGTFLTPAVITPML